MLVVERDYRVLTSSKYLCWADLIISHGTGIIFRPLSVLSTECGGRSVISAVTLLSLQYHTCWIILYQEDQEKLVSCLLYVMLFLLLSFSLVDMNLGVMSLISCLCCMHQ